MKKTILAYGELLWDLLPSGKVLGGAPTNFIYRVNLFGDNGKLVSRLGNDALGEEARKQVLQLELSDRYIQTDTEFPTGTVPVTLDEKGIPDFTIVKNVAFDHIELNSDMLALSRRADCICFGTLVQREKKSRDTLQALLNEAPNAIKFLDINLRKECFSSESIIHSLQLTNIVKINDDELLVLKEILQLKGNTLKELASEVIEMFQLKLALVTLGAKGAFVVSKKGKYFYDPGYKVELGDTVGSGDACSAGFMHYYLNKHTLEDSLKFGNAAGAIVATTNGGTQPITKEEIIQFMEQPHERVSM